jgi:hypothetical protein
MSHNMLSGTPRIKWGGNSPVYTLATFQSQFAKGQGSLNATPLYVGAATHDLRLAASSPGVDDGTASAVYTTFRSLYGLDINRDRQGTSRPQGLAWDLGGFEVGGAASPIPQIRIGDVTVAEGDGGTTSATFTVSLSRASSRTVTVAYATADGSADARTDYVATSGTLSFPPGTSTRTISVAVRRDDTPEASEFFFVELSRPAGATVADGQGRCTIADDDQQAPLPSLAIGDVVVTEGATGFQNAVFTVSLSAPSRGQVGVTYTTGGGTAVPGRDYIAVAARLLIPAGATTGRITVLLKGDAPNEPDETFLVTLSGATGARIARAQGRCTIRDDAETVAWVNPVGVKATGNSLAKTAASAWGNAGAVSSRALASGNGFVEFTISETGTSRMLGLSNGDTDHRYSDIDFAVAPNARGEVHVYEKGAHRGSVGKYAIGDRLRVAVVSGAVRYYRNGVLLRTSALPPRYPLRVDTSLHGTGATITGAVLSGTLVSVPAPNERVAWIARQGVAAATNSLTKTTPRGWGNSGAVSSRAILSGDGYVEFTAEETTTYRMLGLGNGNTSHGATDIDFAIQASGVGRLLVYEKGVYRGEFGAYAGGDRLRIAVVAGAVRYYRNGQLFYTSRVAPAYPLLVDSALYSTGATVKNVVLAGTLGSTVVAQR